MSEPLRAVRMVARERTEAAASKIVGSVTVARTPQVDLSVEWDFGQADQALLALKVMVLRLERRIASTRAEQPQ